MKPFLVVFGLLLLALHGQEASKPDLSTPETTLRAFVAAFNTLDFKKATVCIIGAKSTPKLDALETEMKHGGLKKALLSINALEVKTEKDTATAHIRLTGSFSGDKPPGDKTVTREEDISLRQVDEEWKIVPGDQHFRPGPDSGIILTLATAITYPDMLLQARGRAVSVACLSNVKQIALGCLMLLEDMDEKFVWKAATYKKSIMPYLKTEVIFHCPADKSGGESYTFNSHLIGSTLLKVKYPAKTVLIYEGKHEKLDFRHEGRATVGFVDGHSKLITSAEAKALRWNP